MDRHDTLTHWLAFDKETTRIKRRQAARAQAQAIHDGFRAIGAAYARAAQLVVESFRPIGAGFSTITRGDDR